VEDPSQEARKHVFAFNGSPAFLNIIREVFQWELLERLHAGAATSGIPTLVVSTDPRLLARAQEQAAQYGTHHYLEKPFDLDAVLTQIREMIGEA
jgi:response regulator RpfG family c-di-GMP phosphodiesterase